MHFCPRRITLTQLLLRREFCHRTFWQLPCTAVSQLSFLLTLRCLANLVLIRWLEHLWDKWLQCHLFHPLVCSQWDTSLTLFMHLIPLLSINTPISSSTNINNSTSICNIKCLRITLSSSNNSSRPLIWLTMLEHQIFLQDPGLSLRRLSRVTMDLVPLPHILTTRCHPAICLIHLNLNNSSSSNSSR